MEAVIRKNIMQPIPNDNKPRDKGSASQMSFFNGSIIMRTAITKATAAKGLRRVAVPYIKNLAT